MSIDLGTFLEGTLLRTLAGTPKGRLIGTLKRKSCIQKQLVVLLGLEVEDSRIFKTRFAAARRRYYTAFDAKEFRVGADGMVDCERLLGS